MREFELSSFLSIVPMPAIVVGPDERVAAVNGSAEALAGQPLLGRHYMSVLRQPDLVSAIEDVRRDGAPRMTRMRQIRGEADAHIDVHCTALQEGDARYVVLWFEDVTHVERVGQMRRDFVANVSHELRTPLTALIGFIETLQGPAKDDPAARAQFLEIMAREASRMERLVSDLLSLSRVESDERRPPTESIEMGALLRSVTRTFRPQADEAGVTVSLELPDAPVMIIGDEDQLRQVFSNLIENAIKYGGSGKQVYVSVTPEAHIAGLRGRGVTVSVRDEGPGIDPLHLPRLTERFYRVDSHRSREVGGTGLGLAIVKHIVSRHKGRLKVTSDVGQGSEFSVTLPAS